MMLKRSHQRRTVLNKQIIVIIAVALILLQLILARRALFGSSNIPTVHLLTQKNELFQYFNTKESELNARQVRASREALLSCEIHRNETSNLVFAAPPPTARQTAHQRKYPKRCQFVFLDLGANLGDSLGKFVDSGLSSSCTNGAMYRYKGCQGVEVGFNTANAPRKLTDWVRNTMTKFQKTHGDRNGKPQPELYCYVGMEGNPRFRQRLLELQECVMQTIPRPLRSVHMYTETVATGEGDGPTLLYLDTVNAKSNFFGSSLLQTHTDVRNSAQLHGTETAQVQGITLSSLLKETVQFGAGSHVMIKIDIEGAEYKLLNEAYDSNALCDCAQHGVRVDVRVEIHPKKTLGGENADLDRFKNIVRYKLKECGVNVEVVGDAG